MRTLRRRNKKLNKTERQLAIKAANHISAVYGLNAIERLLENGVDEKQEKQLHRYGLQLFNMLQCPIRMKSR